MIVKGIGATTHLDKHNCRLSKKVLEDTIRVVNGDAYAVRLGIEHNSTIMPIGKIIKGRIIELDDGEYAVEFEQEIFDKYQVYTDIENVNWYIAESLIDSRPFSDTQMNDVMNMKISIDPVNYLPEEYHDLLNFYNKDCLIDSDCIVRKSIIPDPEIVITLVTGTIAILAGKKILEKISESIANDASRIYELIRKIVLETARRCISDKKSITYIIRENNVFMLELVVITDMPEILLDALTCEKISQVETKITEFKKNINININKVQCLYNEIDKKWDINYISTKDGKVIGSEKCYKKPLN